jgi:tetratricopeptide (TPR) repeat protein/predicted Ser/Thr protein kinase
MVGRYVLLECVGEGGMGVVHRAYDPALDRRVAVKLLHVSSRHDARRAMRLQREARAVAQISHPNVVSVHDVSTAGDDVFIAMEFIDGPTLGTWLEKPRSLDEILAVFEQAAEGLSAAHEQGVVHRDFKPDNIFVAGGRVVVADFGLARTSSDGDTPDVDERPASWDVALTRPGAVAGTPGYMAPEQLRGAPASARADQFAFCVVLWEALYGAPPFPYGDRHEELRAIERGPSVPAQPRHRVPRWLDRVLRQGVSFDPERRFVSLRALLGALREGRRRRRQLVLASAALTAALLVGSGFALVHDRVELCPRADGQLRGIWDDRMSATVAQSLSRAGAPLAVESAAIVRSRLDGYAQAWLAAQQDACAATNIRHEQSGAALDLRMNCLRRRRLELGAFVAQLAGVSSLADTQRAVTALEELVPVASCADAAALASGYPPITDPAVRRSADKLERELAAARATFALGRYEPARQRLEQSLPAVRQLGYAPLLVDFLVERGRVLRELADFKAMRPALEEAALLAGRAGRDDALVTAQSGLVYLKGLGEDQAAQALDMLPLIRPVAERLPEGSQERFELGITEARVGLLLANGDQGLSAIERVVRALPAAELGRRAVALQLEARILQTLGRLDAALPVAEEAVATTRRAFGSQHPNVGIAMTQLGDALLEAGKKEAACSRLEEAIAILRLTQGDSHRSIARAKYILAGALSRMGGHERALTLLAEARDAYVHELGEQSTAVRSMEQQRGNVLLLMGRPHEALEVYEDVLARLLSATNPASDSDRALLLSSLGEAALLDGQRERARRECAAALAIHRSAPSGSHAQRHYALDCLGRAQLALGHARLAIPLLRQASSERALVCTPLECAVTRYFLGQALWQSGSDRQEAVSLVQEALTIFEQEGRFEPWLAAYPAQARAWLAAHRL